jgi:hypothetical protein
MFPYTLHGAEKDVYAITAYQVYPLGTKLVTPNGSIFRYTEMGGTAGVAAKLYQSEAPTAGWLSQAATVALAVGDATITFRPTSTALVANDLARGTVVVEETDDLGAIYPIKSHPAAAADADCVLTLDDGVLVQVAVAVAAGNVLTALKNPWKDVIIHPSPNTAMVAGVPRVVISANAFGWLQTRGTASCLVEGTQAIGDAVMASATTDGALAPMAAATDFEVGFCMEVAPTGDFGHVFLTID